jgi:hypothetical protein
LGHGAAYIDRANRLANGPVAYCAITLPQTELGAMGLVDQSGVAQGSVHGGFRVIAQTNQR